MTRVSRAAAALLAALALGCAREPHPNVLWIVIDTLRADALHVQGFPQPITPAMDALAAAGVRFDQHHSNASQTVPATLAMLLSRHPAQHGFSPAEPGTFASQRPVYPPSFEFVAEVLRDAGYATAAYTANPYLQRENGFDQGFDTFETSSERGDVLVQRASRWLEAWAKDRSHPFHLYLHLMDVHQPYDPPEEWRRAVVPPEGAIRLEGNRAVPFAGPRDFAFNAALYADAVAWADELVRRVLADLDRLDLRETTLVVLTSDHGEEFGEHGGVGHGRTVYGEVVRVPLVLVWPRRLAAGRVVPYVTQHLDLAPTVLHLAGVPRPAAFEGRSVFEPNEAIFLETARWRGVVSGDAKLVWDLGRGERRLFALADRLDRTPVEEPTTLNRLGALLEAQEARRATPDAPAASGDAWSEAEQERLRALGYVE